MLRVAIVEADVVQNVIVVGDHATLERIAATYPVTWSLHELADDQDCQPLSRLMPDGSFERPTMQD